VGKVEIDIDGGAAAILYAVFAAPKDAAANWKSEKLTKTETKVRVPGVPTPALMLTGSRPGLTPGSRGTLVGYTAITFVSEDVILEAFTTSRSSKSRGDARTTVALAELAYRHLTTVARRLTG
jgi:hypothetical protein